MSAQREIYISTDIEADGPIPGPNSMLSFGSVALTSSGEELSCFTRNLETLPGAQGDPDTMVWWMRQPEAWKACRTDCISPLNAMREFVAWVKGLDGKPVFVAYPAGFDFLFMYFYMMNFARESPFSFSALDIKSFAMGHLKNVAYRDCTKRNFPKHWFPKGVPHTHVALDDAREQGQMFINILRDVRGAPNGEGRYKLKSKIASMAIAHAMSYWGKAWGHITTDMRETFLQNEIVQLASGHTWNDDGGLPRQRDNGWTAVECFEILEICKHWSSTHDYLGIEHMLTKEERSGSAAVESTTRMLGQ